MRTLCVLVIIIAVLVFIFGWSILSSPRETYKRHQHAAGHNAVFLCSGHFVAGREKAQILAEEIGFAWRFFSAPGSGGEIEKETRSALGWAARGLIKRRAVFRPGMGCTLMGPGWSMDRVATLPYAEMPLPAGDRYAIDWPMGDRILDEATPDALDSVLDRAFDGVSYANPDIAWRDDTKTLGVVVVHKGRLIGERYAPGRDMRTQYRTYSAAKSFSNALAGILVKQGRLDIDAPAPFAPWRESGSDKQNITVRHLLHMSSGLKCGRGLGDSIDVYFGGGLNIAQEAMAREVIAAPGERWCYDNFDTNLVVYAARVILNDDQAYLTFPRRMLLNKLGMRDTYPETDAYGNFIMSSQIWTTPRDLARFGLLYLHDGIWPYGEKAGERILPKGWVKFTRTRAPAYDVNRVNQAMDDKGYGAQFWIVDRDPRLPKDTFAAIGHGHQIVTIIPSRELVVVRTGLMYWKHEDFVADVLNAIETSQ